jgi:hypothetical protein
MSTPLPKPPWKPHWLVHHGAETSAIETFAVPRGEIEVIAEIYDAAQVDHAANATFIVEAVNSYERHCKLILDLTAALERCFVGNGAQWPTTARKAKDLCARARRETAVGLSPAGLRSRN